jgi:uncharacterized membrane protein YfcA
VITSVEWSLLGLGAFIIGLAKAGFGGGMGIAVAPMLATVMPSRAAIGLMLPLLIAGDVVTLVGYRGGWDRRNLIELLPGAVVGIAAGGFVLAHLSAPALARAIGAFALFFAAVQHARDHWQPNEKGRRFHPAFGAVVGLLCGLVSTLSHIGGILTTMYLLPQRLGNATFVATASALYFSMNIVKLIPYCRQGILTPPMLWQDAFLLPLLFAGALTGFVLNRRVSSGAFNRIVLLFVAITGLKLLVLGA